MEEYVSISPRRGRPIFSGPVRPVLSRIAELRGFGMTVSEPAGDSLDPWLDALRQAVKSRAAGVLIDCRCHETVTAAIDEAVDSGIPVITVGTDHPDSRRLAHVGMDWSRLGIAMARSIRDLTEGKGEVLIIGPEGHPGLEAGLGCFVRLLEKETEIEVVGPCGDLQEDWDQEEARDRFYTLVEDHLRDHPRLAGIIAVGEHGAVGAARALLDNARDGQTDKVRLICVDPLLPDVDLLSKGAIDVAFFQRRDLAAVLACQMLLAYNHGTEVTGFCPGAINIPGDVVDAGFRRVDDAGASKAHWDAIDLDEAEARFHLLQKGNLVEGMIESTSHMVLCTDAVGRVIRANPACLQMTGHAAEELRLMNINELLEQGVGGRTIPLDLKPGGRKIFEGIARRKDRSFFPVEIDRSALESRAGLQGFVVHAARVIDHHDSQVFRRDSEAHFRAMITAFDGLIYVCSQDNRVEFMNERLIERTGRDATGEFCYQALHDLEDVCSWCVNDRVFQGETVRWEVCSPKDNRWYYIVNTPIYHADGSVSKQAMILDITDRKHAEEALKASEENYRAIFNAVSDVILILDIETGAIVDANRNVLSLLGYYQEKVRTMTFGELSAGEPGYDEQAAREKISCAATGERELFEWKAKDASDRIFWIEVSLKRAVIGGEQRLLTVVRDIDERKTLEERLHQSQKMEAIGRLAGGIAHDFNNILTAIIGYSNISAQETLDSDTVKQTAELINQAARRGTDLTRQLLAFSRKQVLSVKVLDLNEILAEMEMMLRRVIGDDIDLHTVLDPALQRIKADPGQIEQIVMNLAVNARDAMPQGGRLTMETANVTLDENYARTHAEVETGEYVVIAVSDMGEGMDEAIRSRIFEPFFTTKDKGKGTGFGLSTAYGIVKQHRGHIAVYSEPGIGTTFKVYLPVTQAKVVPVAAEVTGSRTISQGNETVLVVEDEDLVRKVARRILEMHGYDVLVASDPKEAIAISDNYEGAIHLLLTDVVMMQMDGSKLFDTLHPKRPDMRVIFMSGYAENAVSHHGVIEPSAPFLEKPFTVETLVQKVQEILDESSAPSGDEN